MKNDFKKVAWLLLLVFTGTMAAPAQQDGARAPKIRRIKYQGDMAHLLATLADSNATVIGLETDPQKPFSQITIDLHDAALPDILNGVVQSEPLYQWRESNGSIEVVPVNRSSSLVNTPIDKFRVKDVTAEEAIDWLVSLPEVQANARSMGLNRRPSAASAAKKSAEKQISLDLSGVNMREVLTRIAAESEEKFWIFRTFPDGSFSLGVSPR